MSSIGRNARKTQENRGDSSRTSSELSKTGQSHTLTHLGQCDPFDATVDAAIFVARKLGVPPSGGQARVNSDARAVTDTAPAEAGTPNDLLFIQARPRKTDDGTPRSPDDFLETLPSAAKVEFHSTTALAGGLGEATHGIHGPHEDLRVHRVPVALYRAAHKRAFFEPRPGTLRLFEKFNEPIKQLCDDWWERIETSEKFNSHRDTILAFAKKLKSGEVTLVGLIAEGGQGLATANNAGFLGYLEGTPQADDILARRETWTNRWLADPAIKPVFLMLLRENGGDMSKPAKKSAPWEACVEPLRAKFTAQQLGFKKTDLYRIAPKSLVAGESDLTFTWQQRKKALLIRWRSETELAEFWTSTLSDGEKRKCAQKLHKGAEVSDADFCLLCGELQRWLAEENAARKRQRQSAIPRAALGLRSGEDYPDPADAPRIAVIYNGLAGHGQFLPFLKGDPEGNLWLENEPLFISWSKEIVDFLATSPKARWQGQEFFLRAGISWTRGANHVPLKAKLIEPAIMDVNAMKLSPLPGCGVSSDFLLAVFNSDVFSFFLKKFIAHTWMAQISDLRMMPLVMPTRSRKPSVSSSGPHLCFDRRVPKAESKDETANFSDDTDNGVLRS